MLPSLAGRCVLMSVYFANSLVALLVLLKQNCLDQLWLGLLNYVDNLIQVVTSLLPNSTLQIWCWLHCEYLNQLVAWL
jgi:hypothetical protein